MVFMNKTIAPGQQDEFYGLNDEQRINKLKHNLYNMVIDTFLYRLLDYLILSFILTFIFSLMSKTFVFSFVFPFFFSITSAIILALLKYFEGKSAIDAEEVLNILR